MLLVHTYLVNNVAFVEKLVHVNFLIVVAVGQHNSLPLLATVRPPYGLTRIHDHLAED